MMALRDLRLCSGGVEKMRRIDRLNRRIKQRDRHIAELQKKLNAVPRTINEAPFGPSTSSSRVPVKPGADEERARRQGGAPKSHKEHGRKVAADDNCSERSLRPLVIARKLSFGSQSPEGAETRGLIMSVLHSLHKQGHQPEAKLAEALDASALDPDLSLDASLFPPRPPSMPLRRTDLQQAPSIQPEHPAKLSAWQPPGRPDPTPQTPRPDRKSPEPRNHVGPHRPAASEARGRRPRTPLRHCPKTPAVLDIRVLRSRVTPQ